MASWLRCSTLAREAMVIEQLCRRYYCSIDRSGGGFATAAKAIGVVMEVVVVVVVVVVG